MNCDMLIKYWFDDKPILYPIQNFKLVEKTVRRGKSCQVSQRHKEYRVYFEIEEKGIAEYIKNSQIMFETGCKLIKLSNIIQINTFEELGRGWKFFQVIMK